MFIHINLVGQTYMREYNYYFYGIYVSLILTFNLVKIKLLPLLFSHYNLPIPKNLQF